MISRNVFVRSFAWLGEYNASAFLTPLVKPGGSIRPIAVGTVWRCLVSKVSAILIGHSLDGYLDGLQFGVGVAGGSEAILYSVNRLIEAFRDYVGLLIWLVDFKKVFNLVDREGDPLGPLVFFLVLHPLICKIRDSFSLSLHAWYLNDGTIVRDTMVVRKEDPRSRRAGTFPPNIARPLPGVKLLGGAASVDFDICNELVMKRVAKTSGLIDSIANINDPQCELLLLRSCKGIYRLCFTMRTCPPCVFEFAQHSFDVALRSSIKRIFTTSGLGFGIPLFSVLKPCSACSKDFTGDIYGLHVVSRIGIIGIKHRYNVVRDTLVDICYRSGISVDFVSGCAMIDVVERKHFKFMAKCVSIGYGFLPFSFSYLGELEEDAVTLLKGIRKVSMAKDIRARVVVHIFNRIGFAIARGVGAQLVS
nr:hypothetical protein [Tanacetum cinerariifolium]